jgi:hypothetical protein
MVVAVLLDIARPQLVGRVHLHAVGQTQQTLGEAPVEVRRGLLAPEVGPAHVAHEERVAGEHEPGLGAATEIGHEQRDAVRGVAGHVHHLERHVADPELPAVLHRIVGEGGIGGGVEVDPGPGPGRQRLVARHVVGVHVGLEDTGDGEPLAAGHGHVVVHAIAGRIHHDRLAGLGAADQIGETAGLLVQDLLEDHAQSMPHGAEGAPCRGAVGE